MSKRQPPNRIEPTLGRDERSRGLHAGPGDRAHVPARETKPRKASPSGRARRKAGRADERRPQKRRGFSLTRFFTRTVYWSLVLGLWGLIGLAGVFGYTLATMPQTSEWAVPKRPPNIEILDASGHLIANRGDTGGEAVTLAELPPYVPEAVIAIEDRRFYHHFGLDPIGLARALFTNAATGDMVQGGSTLTQQLAKNLFLTPDRTLERKLQEAVLALWLEWTYSKDQILEMYLNRVYLGGGAYGVDGAARRYYARPARDLTLHQAAVLAGLLKAPSRLSPATSPDRADARARVVLTAMVEEGFVSDKAALSAMAEPAGTVTEHRTRASNYAADWVMELLPGYVASLDGDLVISTTIDLSMQTAAEAAIRETLAAEGAKHAVTQGALVAIDGDGAVRAMVGGRDYGSSQFNRAVDAHRQPGSAFKPFVYLAAVEHGYRPEQIVVDEPVTINGWTPQNYSRTYEGPVTLTTALAKSINTVSARLAALIGPSIVVDTARRVGIVSRLAENPSIALGTSEVTPLELTAAYVPFSNGGEGVIPFVIEKIANADGKVLFQRQGGRVGRVIDPTVVGTMNRMLQQVLEIGTGQKAVLPGRPAGGKTGTSQEFRDAWFLGYVNGLTAGVWLGNDDNSPTKKATGGSLTALVWNRFMRIATEGRPVEALPGVDLYLPTVEMETPVADGDGLPALGPDGPTVYYPPKDIPVTGPSDADRNLLDRLLGG